MSLVALVCLALMALLATAQVAHTHPLASDADRCSLCIVMHSEAPAAAVTAVVILVEAGTPEPSVETRPMVRYWYPKLFTRPPPADC